MEKQILSYALKYQGEYWAMKKAIESNECWQPLDYAGKYITILSENYPSCLLELENPPFILFYEGDLSLLQNKLICVIGSRRPSIYAKPHIQTLMKHLTPQWTILSGLAMGVDGLAHEQALDFHRKTVGVVGCGIDQSYPQCNQHLYKEMSLNHCILSEYPNGAKPLAHHFPWRNRILAALCKKCVVIEAQKKSGTLITVSEAINLNREVFVFPHRYEDTFAQGSNQLIQLGANLILDEEDIELI